MEFPVFVVGALYDSGNADRWQLLLYDFTETEKDVLHKMDSS